MHPLAFDKQGKPFSFDRRTRQLLTRLFRNPAARGTCSQVFDDAGEPLYVDADAEVLEFRSLVHHVPGLYRLDQCDDDGVPIEGAPPAYVSIEMTRNAAFGGGGGDVNPLAIIERLVAIQADVMKTMAAQQASLLSATAEVMRAPYRPALPSAAPERESDDKDDADDCAACEHADEGAAEDSPPDPWGALRPMMDMIEPHVPKLGAFLYEQFVEFLKRTKTEAGTPPSASSPAAAPAPTPTPAPAAAVTAPSASAQADAAVGSSSPPFAAYTTSTSAADRASDVTTTVAAAVEIQSQPVIVREEVVQSEQSGDPIDDTTAIAPFSSGEPAPAPTSRPPSPAEVAFSASPAMVHAATPILAAATQQAAPPSAGTPTSAAPTVAQPAAPRNAVPEPTPEQVRHLLEIRERLTDKERAIAENAISRMPPSVLADWLAELSRMTIDQATQMLRQMIAKLRAPRPGARG